MKKLFLFLFIIPMMMLVYPLTCDAMKMSEPIKIGSIKSTDYMGMHGSVSYVTFENAVANTGKKRIRDGKATYDEGCVTFGKGDLAICVDYSREDRCYMSDKSKLNKVELPLTDNNNDIIAIKTDSNIIFYCIKGSYAHGEGDRFWIFGKLPDGRFIQYVDSNNLTNQYEWYMVSYQDVRTEENAIIIPYKDGDFGDRGELYFTWDEKAQWFGVEKR